MQERLQQIQQQAKEQIEAVKSIEEVEQLRIKYLGRKCELSQILSSIKSLPADQKPIVGKIANSIKNQILEKIDSKTKKLKQNNGSKHLAVDITLPGVSPEIGCEHPLIITLEKINNVFENMGFGIVEGPEIETEYNNFEALNIPLDHPSRDAFDTFYINNTENFSSCKRRNKGNSNLLLRSHTSPVQIRVMQKIEPPIRIIVPGKVYRPDAVDASHSFVFHQIEGLMVDKTTTFADLKGILSILIKKIFGENAKIRFRPHFFPFTEPSAEVDVSCLICKGKGCRVCSQSGWLEIMGCGMVDPAVFKAVNYDADKYQGFAFGMGVERIAMLIYGITDIRLFYDNDMRFLEQFK